MSDLRDASSWGCSEDDVKNEINEFIQNQDKQMSDKEIENFKKLLKYDELMRNARELDDDDGMFFSLFLLCSSLS